MAELASFVVHEQHRTEHRGDALLDYVEQLAKAKGIRTLFLMTTRTSDWFVARGFESEGFADGNPRLPKHRRASIDPRRKSKLFVKQLDHADGSTGPPGSRIGY
mmetsp:Transcript_8240/g.21251  ORF Transcript_8240/g.21251 Transcript_8240/m.21251 type:complete len:104 (+) Transcript_8240:232-543(+)